MRILLAAHPAVGHTNGLVTVARRLVGLGADVRFALPVLPRLPLHLPESLEAGLRIPDVIAAAGARVVPLPMPYEVLPYALAIPWMSGSWELRCVGAIFTAGLTRLARAIDAELEAAPADMVVADYLFLAAWLAAERRGVPFCAFYHSSLPFPHPNHEVCAGDAAFVRAIETRVGRARHALGLPAAKSGFIKHPYGQDLNILATAQALEGRDDDFGPRTHYVGPCVAGRVEHLDGFPFHRFRADAFKVYISLGTVFNHRPDRFRALIRGLSDPSVQLVISAGASHERLSDLASDNILIFPRVPQLAVLRAVDAVVSHGGNNTVNEALAAGRPLLVVPIGSEQEGNARRVERVGAGILLDRDSLSPDRIREAFGRLRGTPSFRARAAAIAHAVAAMDGAGTAAQLILEAAGQARASL